MGLTRASGMPHLSVTPSMDPTVKFPMTDGTRRVVCAVTQRAVERLLGAKLQTRQLMQVFRELREIIERCASAKFDVQGVADGDLLLLEDDDLVSETRQSFEG